MQYPRFEENERFGSVELYEICHLHLLMQKAIGIPRRISHHNASVIPMEIRKQYWEIGDLISEMTDDGVDKNRLLASITLLDSIKDVLDETWIGATEAYQVFSRRFDTITTRTYFESLSCIQDFGFQLDLENIDVLTWGYLKPLR